MAILVLKEKHDDVYYSYETQAELNAIFGDIVKSRYEDGYYYPTLESVERELADAKERAKAKYSSALFDLTDEEIKALPEKLRAEAELTYSKLERICENLDKDAEEEILLAKLSKKVAESDEPGKVPVKFGESRISAARYIMELRNSYGAEYETYETIRVVNEPRKPGLTDRINSVKKFAELAITAAETEDPTEANLALALEAQEAVNKLLEVLRSKPIKGE